MNPCGHIWWYLKCWNSSAFVKVWVPICETWIDSRRDETTYFCKLNDTALRDVAGSFLMGVIFVLKKRWYISSEYVAKKRWELFVESDPHIRREVAEADKNTLYAIIS